MDLRIRAAIILLFGALAVAVWTFPAWRHSLQPPSAQGGFPGLELEWQDEYLALPRDQREELLEIRATDPAKALDLARIAISEPQLAPADEDSRDPESAREIVSGEFIQVNALRWGAGTATIFEWTDRQRTLQFSNFESAQGGDMRVYLSRDPQPLEQSQLGADYLDLGRLKGNIGDQSYLLPAGHDLSIYMSAVVFCRQFDEVITVATLR